MYVHAHHTYEQLATIQEQTQDSLLKKRLTAVMMAKQLVSAKSIGHTLGYSTDTIYEWVAKYNNQGIDGLQRYKAKGRPHPFTRDEEKRFRARIEAGPHEDEKICAFRGHNIQDILKNEFGKLRKLSSVYALLHRLGYGPLEPRPLHYKADLEKQEAYKKNSRQSRRDQKSLCWTGCRDLV